MPVTRRRLFKFLGAAILAAPFAVASPAIAAAESLHIVPLESTLPLREASIREPHVLTREIQPVYLGNETLYPRIMFEFPGPASREDPLGMWGYVAWKIKLPNDKQYGHWIKVSDSAAKSPEDFLKVYEEGLRILDKEMKLLLSKLAPNVTIVTPAVNLQIKKGYTERVVYF